jgi:nucleotide-binding universal stress UspA family protein
MVAQILVPLDGSTLAEEALPHAVRMARDMHCGLTLLRAVPPRLNVTATPFGLQPREEHVAYWDSAHLAAQDYLCEVAHRLYDSERIEACKRVVDGDPATGIVVYAEARPDVTMIVMSTHGRSGIGRWVLGSVAERVVRHAPVPLFLVRARRPGDPEPEPAPGPYRTLLVPHDGSILADQALVEVRRLAASNRVRVVLVLALPQPDDKAYFADAVQSDNMVQARQAEVSRLISQIGKTAELLRAEGLRVDTRIELGRPADVILRGAHEERADAIVMATHGRGGARRPWIGSVAMKVVQGAWLPVLLVRAHAAAIIERAPRREESLTMAGTASR